MLEFIDTLKTYAWAFTFFGTGAVMAITWVVSNWHDLKSSKKATNENTKILKALTSAVAEIKTEQALTNQGWKYHVEYWEKKDQSNEEQFKALWDKKADK